MQRKKQEIYPASGINGATLKWLAIITMFIDHFAATLLDQGTLYTVMRLIGRLSFPIFAYLIIQGYQHTSNVGKYLGRMFVFALLSEIPFDLAFYDSVYYSQHQNIFFTLTIGILTLAIFEKFQKDENILWQLIAVVVGGLLAQILHTDYGFYGIVLIFGLGVLRHDKKIQTAFGVMMGFVQNPAASVSFAPIWFYNGERGKQNKWFFYIFYPAHLLLLYTFKIY